MPAKARLGDYVAMNCPHGGIGVIVTGSDKEYDDTMKTSRVSDIVICCSCGQSGRIIAGSPNIWVDELAAARINDPEVGTCNPGKKCCPHGRSGTIITGSPTCFLNDT